MSWFQPFNAGQLSQLNPRRICIIKPSAFGDIVQSLPVLSALRDKFPNAQLAWVVKRQWAELIRGHQDLDELLVFDARGGLVAGTSFLMGLRSRGFDLVLDLQGLLRSAVMTWATRAPVRVGLQTAREGAHLACNCVLPGTSRCVPAHLRYRRVAEAIAPGSPVFDARIPVAEEHVAWARERVSRLSGARVAVHMGAAWVTKRWPVNQFAEIVSRLVLRENAAVLLIGGPGDASDGAVLEKRLDECCRSSVANWIGQSNLKQLAALLAQVDLLISNDSGPMHLAAAMGTPVLGLFTCTDPERSGPPGLQHELVSTRVSCRASYRKRCPLRGTRHLACLDELDVDRVWNACRTMLHGRRPPALTVLP